MPGWKYGGGPGQALNSRFEGGIRSGDSSRNVSRYRNCRPRCPNTPPPKTAPGARFAGYSWLSPTAGDRTFREKDGLEYIQMRSAKRSSKFVPKNEQAPVEVLILFWSFDG